MDILGAVDARPILMPGGELPMVGGDATMPVIDRLAAGRRRGLCPPTSDRGTVTEPAGNRVNSPCARFVSITDI
ncbi:MAG TPA: hypothetical protein VFW75_02160 [Acetobacteraceae bacterium]|nr:hypothetical protein [Acetobacteraceae bacterium]